MDHLRKPEPNHQPLDLSAQVEQVLHTHVKQGEHLCIALSGGVDSMVLLDVLAIFSRQMQFTLSTVHVNHGISNNATRWSQFCCERSYDYGVSISVTYLHVRKARGVSLEASAREQRYRVFSEVSADYVVLAHHLDDQAETLLLQLLRGAGIRGLSGMPVIRQQQQRHRAKLLRPLLNVSRHQIERYAQCNNLTWVVDESNDDTAYDRNFLRHEVLPVLKKRYTNYAKTLTRTSRHLSEASALLDELAEIDSERCMVSGQLDLSCLRRLEAPRVKNLLRYTLVRQGIQLPNTGTMENLTQQLLLMRDDAQLRVDLVDYEIRCFKGAVYILHKIESAPIQAHERYLIDSESVIWNDEIGQEMQYAYGKIEFSWSESQGICRKKIASRLLAIRLRVGGESFKPACNRPNRSLKNLLQEAFIPPWHRKLLPLLFCEDRLIWVPGIGIDCDFQVKSGEMGVLPVWHPMKITKPGKCKDF
ncbi:tRNA(Ile)-lysidine synthase [Nitrosomonas sp. PY1]|uniref:tRNA lysidine(34) synthetase TilS n=1 Tax=Nitrosomonas sp. PY1 TaxID=1803906 RepID=UPI001FC7F9A1|nr:tRNA lysidine(34) synthetase TilS [Nitrosomonas sp. PY1]GKS69771.1 tRNA(Ile)-lysidine synthase [Nitrosomonas sp. PY1]